MVELNNQSGEQAPEKFLRQTAQALLEAEGKGAFPLSLALLPKETMRELNFRYRGQNFVPDELSFSFGDEAEVLLCPSQIRKNAGEWSMPLREAYARSLIHAVLHVLGYSHEQGERERELFEEREARHAGRIL